MALNPSTQASSAVEVIDGTVTEYYNIMDQCIRKSEVMPGQYKSITSPSYSNNCPIDESSFTTIDVGCPAPQVVDMNNSFITAKFSVPITFPDGFKVHGKACTFFVGWRSSLDILQRYIIYCNHKLVGDQVYVGEESFVLQSLIPEHVRCRKPYQYTSYENASTHSPNVCGTYITLTSPDTSDSDKKPANLGKFTITVEIPVKIDLNQFLLFTNFKYLPAFAGTWSIKLYPSTQNMIICPVDPKYMLSDSELNNFAGKDLSGFTHNFVQAGDILKCLTTVDNSTKTLTYSDVQITFGRAKVDEILYHQTQFELMYDVYDALKARYMQKPLTIPVNKLDYGRFAGNMKNSGISSTYTAAIQNCESMFILPFTDDLHHTVCMNPEFEDFYMNISGYGNFPQQPFNTYRKAGEDEKHTRFVNMTLDALNLNNSPICVANKDLMNSLESNKVNGYTATKATAAGTLTSTLKTTELKHDRSNFLIGIPFSTDIDFEGGLTSNGNINIKLSSGSNKIDNIASELNGGTSNIGATVMFCRDAALMMKVIPYATEPEVRLVEERIV